MMTDRWRASLICLGVALVLSVPILAGCTTNPTDGWVTQHARNLSFTGVLERTRFLIHDRDSKFTAAFDEVLRSDPDIDHWSSYVGRGAIRFYLPLDVQLQNDFFAETIVVTKSLKARERVRQRLEAALQEKFPEAVGRVSPLEQGPPVGWPVQYRVSGPDVYKVREFSDKLAQIVGAELRFHVRP